MIDCRVDMEAAEPYAIDKGNAARLWTLSEEMVGQRFNYDLIYALCGTCKILPMGKRKISHFESTAVFYTYEYQKPATSKYVVDVQLLAERGGAVVYYSCLNHLRRFTFFLSD